MERDNIVLDRISYAISQRENLASQLRNWLGASGLVLLYPVSMLTGNFEDINISWFLSLDPYEDYQVQSWGCKSHLD